MYFKRISDLHPLDATVTASVARKAPATGNINLLKYYDPTSLWVEVSQSQTSAFEPISSAPTYVTGYCDLSGNHLPATNSETLTSTDRFLSRKCNIAELFRNITELNTANISAMFANLSYITSYYLEGKSADKYFYINVPSGPITAVSDDYKTTMQHMHGNALTATTHDASAIAADQNAAVTFNDTGLTAKEAHAKYQFSVDYRAADAADSTDSGTGLSANCTGISASNIYVPGTAVLTAAAAYWADLAEMYKADRDYSPGTLVKFGGEEEVTIADNDEVNAVVTENPAYLMNASLKTAMGHPVGIVMVGRSKVRVVGSVKKFDRLALSSIKGVATKTSLKNDIIGIALESNVSEDEKLVEATLKINF